MFSSHALVAFVVTIAVAFTGCGGSPSAPTGEDREAALEQHREMSNREMQDIQNSRSSSQPSQ